MKDTKVIIEVEGGVVQRIVTNNKHLFCEVLDHDNSYTEQELIDYEALKAETKKLSEAGHSIYV